MSFEEKRWQLFLNICNKLDLDLKGESVDVFISNFKSAFMKAHNIVTFYSAIEKEVDGINKISHGTEVDS